MESKNSKTPSIFATLTYDDHFIHYSKDGVASVSKRDAQLFIKRLRKNYPYYLRYYLVGEYGTKTMRPHYHIILFNFHYCDYRFIEEAWKYGNVLVSESSTARLHYIAKYHVNRTKNPWGTEKSFCLMSKGIGRDYIENQRSFHKGRIQNSYLNVHGYIHKLPRYFKDKLYSKVERQAISAVMAKKIDPLDIEGFNLIHPNENYFQYQLANQNAFEDFFKNKFNENDKL